MSGPFFVGRADGEQHLSRDGWSARRRAAPSGSRVRWRRSSGTRRRWCWAGRTPARVTCCAARARSAAGASAPVGGSAPRAGPCGRPGSCRWGAWCRRRRGARAPRSSPRSSSARTSGSCEPRRSSGPGSRASISARRLHHLGTRRARRRGTRRFVVELHRDVGAEELHDAGLGQRDQLLEPPRWRTARVVAEEAEEPVVEPRRVAIGRRAAGRRGRAAAGRTSRAARATRPGPR